MTTDTDFMRMGLAALGYEVKEIGITGARYSAFLPKASAPIPTFVTVGWRGALTLAFMIDGKAKTRKGTHTDKYFLRQAGELSFYNGIRCKPEFVFDRKPTTEESN